MFFYGATVRVVNRMSIDTKQLNGEGNIWNKKLFVYVVALNGLDS